jgi:glycosyltransferase involved in cell wall biosynthesis
VRILVAADQWFPDHLGGLARIATDTARGLAGRGHEVTVIAPCHDGPLASDEDPGLTLLRVLPRGRLPQTLTDPSATRRHASRLGRKFDVLVAHSAITAKGLLAAQLGCPLVYVFHAAAADEARFLRSSLRPGPEWLAAVAFERPMRRLTARVVHDADAVIVLSEFSRRVLERSVSPSEARRAVHAAGGVDTRVFSPDDRDGARAQLGVGSETRLVFTVRRLEPRMGIGNLIEAARLLDDVPELRLIVAGGGRRSELEALRDRLDLRSRVELIGRVSEADLPRWHRAADVFVLPTVAYEGFGLVTAEALASGTPVVGTPVGATPELLEPLEPCLVSRGTHPAALAEAIRTGLRLATPAFRKRCRDYALSRLSWDAVLPEWERVLAGTAGGRSPVRKASTSRLPSTRAR